MDVESNEIRHWVIRKIYILVQLPMKTIMLRYLPSNRVMLLLSDLTRGVNESVSSGRVCGC